MLQLYDLDGTALTRRDGGEIKPSTVWIDLIEPTAEEDTAVELALGIAIPTRAEAREIEASSRLYRENGAYYMTAFVLFQADQLIPAGANITFILSGNRLVTVRYQEPKSFALFATRACKGDVSCSAGPVALLGLLETIAERAADLIERTQDETEMVAQGVFGARKQSRSYAQRLDVTLRNVGRHGEITARIEESTFSIDRLLTFLAVALKDRGDPAELALRLDTVQKDIRSLTQPLRHLHDRTTFLLDATLGAISIEQNKAMKVFSLLAVTLMPPTLVGAVYGMNFKHMPELEWLSGYPMALGLMLLSAVLPYVFFRWRGWI